MAGLKAELELAAAQRFLDLYNQEVTSSYRVVGSCKPPEPDVLCEDGEGNRLGIEVTAAYLPNEATDAHPPDWDAKTTWDIARGKVSGDFMLGSPVYKDPGEQLVSQFVAAIQTKSLKAYSCDYPIMLLVEANVAITPCTCRATERFVQPLQELSLPTGIFSEVWVALDLPPCSDQLCCPSYRIERLYPRSS